MTSKQPPSSSAVNSRIAEVVREEWPRLVSVLMRDFGDLSMAEDAAQEAAEAALTAWLDDGIPDRPGAWITTVARRRALDKLRRQKTGRQKMELLARLEDRLGSGEADEIAEAPDDTILRDDQLRLFFGCCHPALSVEAQMALTLRSVGGLTTTEIARGFLIPEATMAQRLVRAKRKIANAAIPFRIPEDAELLGRIEIIHQVLYLVYNEGYESSTGDRAVRSELSDEAIRLALLLTQLMPDDAETLGLAALMLLTDARRAAREGDDGTIILLEDQDRSLWDQQRIADGTALLDRALRRERPGPFQIQAAIAALHDEATHADGTDWAQIAQLYRSLHQHHPTAVVALNRAVATAMAEGPDVGLALLDHPTIAEPLADYRFFHAARADLLRRLGSPEAKAAYTRALELTENQAERNFLQGRLDSVATQKS